MSASPRPPARKTANTSGQPGIRASAVREQVRRLRDEGGTYRSIADAAGLAPPRSITWLPATASPRPIRLGLCSKSPAKLCPAPDWTPAAPACGCGPYTSWATAQPASPEL